MKLKTVKIQEETHHEASIEASLLRKRIGEFSDEAIAMRVSSIRRARHDEQSKPKTKGAK